MKNKAQITILGLLILIMISSIVHAEYVPAQHPYNMTHPSIMQSPVVQNAGADDYRKGELIVKFKDTVEVDEDLKHMNVGYSVSTADLDSLNKINKDKVKSMKRLFKEKKNQLSNVYVLQTDKDEDIVELAKKYKNSPFVEYAEPNYEVHTLETPDDMYYSLQWSHQNANSEAGWNIETGSPGVVIAIVDTGIDFDHPDLDSKVWNNTGEIPGNDIDDDGNGYIDDTLGWDFINYDNYPDDDHFHGTHCSGIAAAETNNSLGVAGVCWNCTIMPVKCLDSGGSGSSTSVALSVRYAADNGADIISLSLGGSSYSYLLEDAVDYAHDNGVIVIVAAGNTGSDSLYYPAAYDSVIAVTASTSTDQKASFSTYGYWTEIAAPGVNIYSTMINSYAYKSGTSMACPFVAGVAGLLLSKNSNLSVDMLETIMKSSTDPVISSTEYMGTGRINVYKALERADSEIVAMIDSPSNGMISSGTISIVGTAEGTYFVNYSLYYAKGIYPDIWTKLSNSPAQVSDSELGLWNSLGLDNGLYTIKLLVLDTKNNTFIDYDHVTLDNQPLGITVNSPLNTTYFSPSILFDITSEFGAVSCSYSVDGQPDISLDGDTSSSDYYNWTGRNTDIAKGQHNVVFSCKDKYGTENSTEAVWFNISANTITGCSVMDKADTEYYIISDISDYSAAGACMNITASNITLYCQDHLVDGIGSAHTYGIYVGADDAAILECQVSQWDYGIYLNRSSGSTVAGNIIAGNLQYGLYLDDAQAGMIHNNLFNSTYNIGFGPVQYPNSWNITIAEGDRIYSLGEYIGGNYWTHPASKGYSDSCSDGDNDGFCDESYNITPDSTNVDYVPLSDKCLYLNISSCQALDMDNMTYLLESDVRSDNTCFTVDADGITLDCNGHVISGIGTGYGINVYINEKDLKNVTIRNCAIDNFHMGIYANKHYYSIHSINNFYLANLNISNNYYGIYMKVPIYSSVLKNAIVYNGDFYGIYLNGYDNGLVADNTIYSNDYTGLNIYNSDNNEITGNTVFENGGSGISISSSYNNTMRNNDMAGNSHGLSVSGKISLNSDQYLHDIDTSNTVDGKPVYYWINKQDMEVPSDAGFVGVINSGNITVKDLNMSNNNPGVLFVNTNNSRIENVNASYNSFNGIYMSHSNNNTIVKNDIVSNYYYGLYMYNSDNNKVADNNIDDNNYGLYMSYSDGNTFTGNNIDSLWYGLYMYYSDNNTVAGNTIGDSNYGFYVSYSKDNSIYDNYIDNTKKPAIYGNYANSWNISVRPVTNIIGDPYMGGNYWANSAGTGYSQTCADADNDGFCDTPYIINSYNTDYLPLSGAYKYSIYLTFYKKPDSTGLNLISLPLEHNFTTAEDLCLNISNSSMITRWDPFEQKYKSYFCGLPLNNFNLEDGGGYFVSVTQNTTLTLTGAKLMLPPINLKTSLNLIGLPYNSIITPLTSQGLCSDIGSSSMITRWDSFEQKYESDFCDLPLNDFNLEDAQGYFVSVTQNTTWIPQ